MRWGTLYSVAKWGAKNFGRVAKGENNFWTHYKGEGVKNFRLYLEFFHVCENNLYVFSGYYGHFDFSSLVGHIILRKIGGYFGEILNAS